MMIRFLKKFDTNYFDTMYKRIFLQSVPVKLDFNDEKITFGRRYCHRSRK